MVLFIFKIAFVIGEEVHIYNLQGIELKKIHVGPVYSICLSASMQNSGQEKNSEHYAENSYYIDVSDNNLSGNPHLKFGDDDEFDIEDEKHGLIIQTLDK